MRKQLGKDEKEALNSEIKLKFGLEDFIAKKQHAELVEEDNIKRIMIDGTLTFVYVEGALVPALKFLLTRQILPAIPVDMGAVKFVTSGADVMRPGIKAFPAGLLKDQIVCVVDEKHNKPLAVGKMLISGEDAIKATSGKTIKNMHWVGDLVWKL
jgi:PUA-domain protein